MQLNGGAQIGAKSEQAAPGGDALTERPLGVLTRSSSVPAASEQLLAAVEAMFVVLLEVEAATGAETMTASEQLSTRAPRDACCAAPCATWRRRLRSTSTCRRRRSARRRRKRTARARRQTLISSRSSKRPLWWCRVLLLGMVAPVPPSASIGGMPPPTNPPMQQPTQQPTQQPMQQPTQQAMGGKRKAVRGVGGQKVRHHTVPLPR